MPWEIIAIVVGAVLILAALKWQAVMELLRNFRRLFTTIGIGVIVLTVIVAVGAVNTKANVLYLLLSVMLAALVFSGVFSTLTFLGIKVSRKLPEEIYAGAPFRVAVCLGNVKPLLNSYSLVAEDRLPSGIEGDGIAFFLRVPARGTAEECYEARASRRGVYRLEGLGVASRFPFGFFYKTRFRPAQDEVVVFPKLGTINWGAFYRSLVLTHARRRRQNEPYGDDEFKRIREFRPGDNPKRIHWRSSARRRKLMIREYERRLTGSALILLDTAAGEGSDLFERAISFAATAARDLSQQGYSVALAGLLPKPTLVEAPTEDGLARIYEALARTTPASRSLRALFEELEFRDEYELALVVDLCSDRSLPSMAGAKAAKVWWVDTRSGSLDGIFEV